MHAESIHVVALHSLLRTCQTNLVIFTQICFVFAAACANLGQMWDRASSEILGAIRGRESKAGLSRRLGYLSNPVRDWEAGRRFPTCAEALRVAMLRKIDVRLAFARFHRPSADQLSDCSDESVARWLTTLTGTIPILELAKRTDQSRFQIGRWLKGDSRPRFPDFLRLVDGITGRASDLVAELVDINKVPALLALHTERSAAKELAFVEPWTEAVMRLFETDGYLTLPNHDPVWVAQRLDISEELVDRCISRMVKAGVVKFDKKHFRVVDKLTVYTGSNQERVLRLKEHWSEVGHARLQKAEPDDWFGYNVMSLSQSDLDRVEALLKNTFNEIRSIVATTPTEETVALAQLSLVRWKVDPNKTELP